MKTYKMTLDDVRLLAINTTTLAISFSHIEDILKIVLLILSIGYTFQKWYDLRRGTKKEG